MSEMDINISKEVQEQKERIKVLEDFISSFREEVREKDEGIKGFNVFCLLAIIGLAISIFAVCLLVIYKL